MWPRRVGGSLLPERFNPPYYLTGEDFIRYVLQMQATEYDRRGRTHFACARSRPCSVAASGSRLLKA
jgi:hypothetical protein